MKQTAQSDTKQAQNAVGLAHSTRTQQKSPATGRLAQLARMMNASSRVQHLTQIREDIQQSHPVQRLAALAAEINSGVPAQLRGVPVNDDADLEQEADVMGSKARHFAHDQASGDSQVPAQLAESGAPLPGYTGSQPPVQRVRILLKDEDPILMGRLRLVPVANAGAQTLQDPGRVRTLTPIGRDESIVLEGHGYEDAPLFGTPTVISQGGIPPAQLAALVRNVPKPGDWSGNVVLLGCSTGSIAASVSQEYFKLTGTPVKVIGTRTNIRVGTKEDGSSFIGSDWSRQPGAERPADLAFVQDLISANKEFLTATEQLFAICSALENTAKGTPTPIPHPIDQVQARGRSLLEVDTTSLHRASRNADRRYARPARTQMAELFQNVFSEIRKVDFFRSPNTLLPIANALTARAQVADVTRAMLELSERGMALYKEVDYELHGYLLKEIDLTSNVSALHSKRRRTKIGIFGDTWVDES